MSSVKLLVVAVVIAFIALPDAASGAKSAPKPSAKPKKQTVLTGDSNPPKSAAQLPAEVNLVDSKQCGYDVVRLCPADKQKNNFAVLECFQKDTDTYRLLRPECQRFIWMYKRNLTVDNRFEMAARGICGVEVVNRTGCMSSIGKKGHLIGCLIENFNKIPTENCRYFLTKMAIIVFTDYRLIENFYEECDEDVKKLSCQELQPFDIQKLLTNETALNQENEETQRSIAVDIPIHQGETIRCLQMKLGERKESVSERCQLAIFRVSELQANDFTLDRPLYYACRNDRERFCTEVVAGEGRVYACLMSQMAEHGFSKECRLELHRRQVLMQQDVRIDKPFVQACQSALDAYKCETQSNSLKILDLSHALVCLNDALNEDDPLHVITPVCTAELAALHRLVFADKPLTPNIVTACSDEIAANCNDERYNDNVAELFHCLMEHAVNVASNKVQRERAIGEVRETEVDRIDTPHKGLSDRCYAELRVLMREADVVEDVRVDPVLYAACEPVIKVACSPDDPSRDDSQQPKEHDSPSLFYCLLDHVAEPVMTPVCARRLMEIEYFVTRDYHLDAALLRACHKPAREQCHAGDQKWFAENPNQRKLFDEGGANELQRQDQNELEQQAEGDAESMQNNQDDNEVDRAGRQKRAPPRNPDDAQLSEETLNAKQPASVIEDLDEELVELQHEDFVLPCLFNLMRRNELHDECAIEVRRTMRQRSMFVGLMPDVERVCFFDLTKLCSDPEDLQPGAEMSCLQDKFNDLHPRCRMMVANYSRDVRIDASIDFYTYRTCAASMRAFCQSALSVRSTWQHAHEVHVRGQTPDAEQHETLMDCLIEHKNDPAVPQPCRVAITHHQRVAEIESIEVSVEFFRACRKDAQVLCPGLQKSSKQEVLACLSEVWTLDYLRTYGIMDNDSLTQTMQYDAAAANQNGLDRALQHISPRCRGQLQREFRQQEEDVELDDVVMNNCESDIRKYCNTPSNKDSRGEIVECLKQNFDGLQKPCRFVLFKHELRDIADQRMDYGLQRACGNMIAKYCADEAPNAVLECLKTNKEAEGFDRACLQVVATREVMQAQDIRLNPQMSKSCRGDVQRYCMDVVREHTKKQRELDEMLDDRLPHQVMRDDRDDAHVANDRAKQHRALVVEFQGEVLHCLRQQYVKHLPNMNKLSVNVAKETDQLSEKCSDHLRFMMRESAMNIHLDPLLRRNCEKEIRDQCADHLDNPSFLLRKNSGDDEGLQAAKTFEVHVGVSHVEQCLKNQFITVPKSFGPKCQAEIIRLFQEARADIHVDPILHKACALDLTFYCQGVLPGMGQQFACLLRILESKEHKLHPECEKRLNDRVEMFNSAMEHAPAESFSDLVDQLARSPNRYFLVGVLLSVVLSIFVIGLSCGCMTRRRAKIVQKSK